MRAGLIGSIKHPDFRLTSSLINESLLCIEGRRKKKKKKNIWDSRGWNTVAHKNYTLISFLMDRKAKWIEHLAACERVIARDRDEKK